MKKVQCREVSKSTIGNLESGIAVANTIRRIDRRNGDDAEVILLANKSGSKGGGIKQTWPRSSSLKSSPTEKATPAATTVHDKNTQQNVWYDTYSSCESRR